MEYIIIRAKDIKGYTTEYDDYGVCNDIIINCASITRIESFTNKEKENPFGCLVLYTINEKKFIIRDDTPIETNWDLIMCYHRKSTRLEL